MTPLERLPWPFAPDERTFGYTVNVQPAGTPQETVLGQWGDTLIDVDETYEYKSGLRQQILQSEPDRAFHASGVEPACWEYLLFVMRTLSDEHPDWAELSTRGDIVQWHNGRLNINRTFTLGDEESLGMDPLTFAGLQVPSDVLLVREHSDGHLYLDAGVVTFPGAWSVTFDAGMSMHEIHGPVPGFTSTGLTDRLETFMKTVTPDKPYRRVNWAFSGTGSERLDTSLESKPQWGWDADQLVMDGEWGRMRLRLELEHILRLPNSQVLVFDIRTYFASLHQIRQIPAWAAQLADIIETVPEPIAEYKGFGAIRDPLTAYLREAQKPAAFQESR